MSKEDQDRQEVRQSIQEAPEQYRKESSYMDLDDDIVEKTPELKHDIAAIIESMAEESDSSKSSKDERPKILFQRRKSSFSSASELEGTLDVGSFNDNPGVSIDDQVDVGKKSGTSDSSESSESSDSEGELEINPKDSNQELYQNIEEIKDRKNSKTSESSESSESEDSEEETEVNPPKENLVIEIDRKSPVANQTFPVDSTESSEEEDKPGTLKRAQFINLKGFSSTEEHSDSDTSSSESEDPHKIQFATNEIEKGSEIQMCTPVVIRTDSSSSEADTIRIIPKKLSSVQEEKTRKDSTTSTSSSSSKSSKSSSSSKGSKSSKSSKSSKGSTRWDS